MKKKWIALTLVFLSVILFNIGLPGDFAIMGKVKNIKTIKHNPDRKYKDRRNYNNIHIITESNKRNYAVGRSIPIKISVINNSGKPFVFDTEKRRNEKEALEKEQLPVYDLIFTGYVVDKAGKVKDYFWSWSKNTKDLIITEIILEPTEKKVLIETVWEPPKVRFIQGGFKVRFADFEFPTGIRIKPPKR